jgi:hypothetical protein
MSGRKIDLNQQLIRNALRAAGATWLDMTQARQSPIHCDAIVLHQGKIYFVEVKRTGGTLTNDERAFRQICHLQDVDYHVIFTPEDALEMLRGSARRG